MTWLVFLAGCACGLVAYGLFEAWQLRHSSKRQRALGLTFGSVGGEPRTPAELDAHMLSQRGIRSGH
ncbi:MAG TPA: hypothetical protein VGH91_04540 [Gammaproteobacteria bacterium]|jgi:hypothetical protein